MADEKRKKRAQDDEPKTRRTFEIRAALDRVEDGRMAVLLLEDDGKSQLDLPVSRLPEGSTGGDHFVLTFEEASGESDDGHGRRLLRVTRDERSRADTAARIRSLQESLAQKSNTAGKKDFKL